MKLLVPDHIRKIAPYIPGKPIEEVEREYGIRDSIKLASNENPLGPSPMALDAIQQALASLHRYPDDAGIGLRERIAQKLSVLPESIVLGNGSDDVISMLTQALLQPMDEAIMLQPAFLWYEISVRSAGAIPIGVPLNVYTMDLAGILDRITPKTRMLFINNPHNPTGAAVTRDALKQFIERVPANVAVVIDEAYIEFARDPSCPESIEFLNSGKAVVGLRTFSKAYGLAGLRIGYGVMQPAVAEILHRIRQPFNANTLAQVAARAALGDETFFQKTIALVHAELDFMYHALDGLGLEYIPSQANFFLINVNRDANAVFEKFIRQGIIVRSMTSYGLPKHIRVNVGLHAENIRFLEVLEQIANN